MKAYQSSSAEFLWSLINFLQPCLCNLTDKTLHFLALACFYRYYLQFYKQGWVTLCCLDFENGRLGFGPILVGLCDL